MATSTIKLTESIYRYMQEAAFREPEILAKLRIETEGIEEAGMQIAPEQGQFMSLIVSMIGARRAIEIGTFTGYSSLCVALALPPDGKLIACDTNQDWTDVARRYWREAGVAERIELHLAPASETLDALLSDGAAGTLDFAFIDADKQSYDLYYERCLELLRPGGLVTLDNMLWSGAVADPARDDADTVAIRAITKKLQGDTRVDISLVPIGDGLMLARKRP